MEKEEYSDKDDLKQRIEATNKALERLPQDSTKDFINEVLSCINNALDNNFEKICPVHTWAGGEEFDLPGSLLLHTCMNLIRLSHSPAEFAKIKGFAEQVQKDVLTSKNLMHLFNNEDWEAVGKVNLASSAIDGYAMNWNLVALGRIKNATPSS